jgi:hypothetical protein
MKRGSFLESKIRVTERTEDREQETPTNSVAMGAPASEVAHSRYNLSFSVSPSSSFAFELKLLNNDTNPNPEAFLALKL